MKKVLIISLVITTILALIENVAGFALAIPFLPGGDAAFGFSLGGNIVVYSFPVTSAEDANAGVNIGVIFNMFVFTIAFFLRTLIVHLVLARKNKLNLFFSDYN